MSLFIKKPHYITWGVILLSLILSFIVDANSIVRPHTMHFPMMFFWYFAAIILFLTGVGYFLLLKYGGRLLNWATIGHLVLLILWVFLISALFLYTNLNPGIPSKGETISYIVIQALIVLSYLCYVINIIVSISRKALKTK